MNISESLETSLKYAFHSAQDYKNEYITLEHLLLGLLQDAQIQRILDYNKVDILALEQELVEFIQHNIPRYKHADTITYEPNPTQAFHRVLHRAAIHVQSSQKEEVNAPDLLVAFFAEKNSHALYFLQKQGITRYDITLYLSHVRHDFHKNHKNIVSDTHQKTVSKRTLVKMLKNGYVNKVDEENDESSDPMESLTEDQQDALNNYCYDLSDKAQKGLIDPLIGRDEELKRLCQIFMPPYKK